MTSWRAYLPLGYANEPFHWPLMEPESRPKEREFCSDTYGKKIEYRNLSFSLSFTARALKLSFQMASMPSGDDIIESCTWKSGLELASSWFVRERRSPHPSDDPTTPDR